MAFCVVKERIWLLVLQRGHLISKLPVPMANSLLQFLQRCFIFRSTLYVSDKIPLPREVAALKLTQAYSAWLAYRCDSTGTSPSLINHYPTTPKLRMYGLPRDLILPSLQNYP